MQPPRSPRGRPAGPPTHRLAVEMENAVDDDEISSELLVHAARRLIDLSEENAQLKEAIENRPVIDQARGMLIAVLGAHEDEAWHVLLETSQHANVPLRHVAEALIASAAGQPIPEDIRIPLRNTMNKVRRHGQAGTTDERGR